MEGFCKGYSFKEVLKTNLLQNSSIVDRLIGNLLKTCDSSFSIDILLDYSLTNQTTLDYSSNIDSFNFHTINDENRKYQLKWFFILSK
jgi:hypothetical protein